MSAIISLIISKIYKGSANASKIGQYVGSSSWLYYSYLN